MAAIPIQDGRTARVDNNGVLDVLVKQPYDNQPTEDSRGCHLEECFKGPYRVLREILGTIAAGQHIEDIYSALQSETAGGIQQCFNYPTCPPRDGKPQRWVCTAVRVEEAEAGDHAYLYLSYDGELALTQSDSTWSVSWQSYSVDPYNFLKNDRHEPYPVSPSFDVDPIDFPPSYWTQIGQREPIDKFLVNVGAGKTVNGIDYRWYTGNPQFPTARYFLNGAEAAVASKKQLGRSATYHYPLITHQTACNADPDGSLSGLVGTDLDTALSSLPSGCPYEFDPMWKVFIKIGDDISQTTDSAGKTRYTRREVYAGFTKVDMNFYGPHLSAWEHSEDNIKNGRWELESL